MIICAVDTETTGLRLETDKIVEIACVIFDTSANHIIESWSSLVYHPTYPALSHEAQEVTGIPMEALRNYGKPPNVALIRALGYFNESHCLAAHNASNFDRPMLEAAFKSNKIALPDKVWIDTRQDLPFSEKTVSRRLQHLSVDHGLQWDYDLAHSALYDCLKMLQMASKYDLEEAYKRAQSPMITVETSISRERNNETKGRRYFWHPESRTWRKNIRECDFEKEKAEATFQIRRVGG